MSDPVKSSEIEDVLSSIRRLVSEEARHEMQARRAEAERAIAPEARAPQDTDALVLTPALRVHEGGRTGAESAEAADAAEETGALDAAPLAHDSESFPESDPAPEAAEVQTPETFDGASHDDAAQDDASHDDAAQDGAPYEEAPYEAAESLAEDVLVALDAAAGIEVPDERPEARRADDLTDVPVEPETLEAKIAALEALISGSNDSMPSAPAPAGGRSEDAGESAEAVTDSDIADPVAEDFGAEADAEDLGEDPAEEAIAWEDHHAAPEASAEAGHREEAEDAAAPEPRISETVQSEDSPSDDAQAEELEREDALSETPESDDLERNAPEPDARTEDSRVADPFVFVSRHSAPGPEAQPIADPKAATSREAKAEDSAATLLAASTPGIIDEEALRDMVVEIVREELQGALGERITRNVRRLVRREIHRALASQELD